MTHEKFGEGVILDVIGDGDKAEAVVRFREAGEKRLLLAWAPLQRINQPDRRPRFGRGRLSSGVLHAAERRRRDGSGRLQDRGGHRYLFVRHDRGRGR